MAQADCMTTAIRELMSHQSSPNAMSPVRAAHAELVGALAGNPPHSIHPDLGSDDLEGRADHLQKVFAALYVYLGAIIADTAQHLPGGGAVAYDDDVRRCHGGTCHPTSLRCPRRDRQYPVTQAASAG